MDFEYIICNTRFASYLWSGKSPNRGGTTSTAETSEFHIPECSCMNLCRPIDKLGKLFLTVHLHVLWPHLCFVVKFSASSWLIPGESHNFYPQDLPKIFLGMPSYKSTFSVFQLIKCFLPQWDGSHFWALSRQHHTNIDVLLVIAKGAQLLVALSPKLNWQTSFAVKCFDCKGYWEHSYYNTL